MDKVQAPSWILHGPGRARNWFSYGWIETGSENFDTWRPLGKMKSTPGSGRKNEVCPAQPKSAGKSRVRLRPGTVRKIGRPGSAWRKIDREPIRARAWGRTRVRADLWSEQSGNIICHIIRKKIPLLKGLLFSCLCYIFHAPKNTKSQNTMSLLLLFRLMTLYGKSYKKKSRRDVAFKWLSALTYNQPFHHILPQLLYFIMTSWNMFFGWLAVVRKLRLDYYDVATIA